jgi:hypothetical protein
VIFGQKNANTFHHVKIRLGLLLDFAYFAHCSS